MAYQEKPPLDELMHYGMPRRSGRYPWGSGDNPYQHSGDFLARVEELRKQSFTFTDDKGKVYTGDTAIAKYMGLSTTQFRNELRISTHERRADQVATAKGLREKGYSLNEIAERMGFDNDSSVRSLLNEHSEARMNAAKKTAESLKKLIDEKGMIDVGVGVERELNVSRTKLDEALYLLEREGYHVYGGRVPQATNPGKKTTLMVLCPPGTEHKEIYNFDNIHSVEDYTSYDGGDNFVKRRGFIYPESLDSSRLQIRYAEDGGITKDGVIELRRGVDDISLGNSHYAQVRIMVDGDRYLKGMAVYSDDMPDGVDVIFNTNKAQGTPMRDVLKKVKDDPTNPFGSLIKEEGGQSFYDDPNGKYTDPVTGKKQSLSLINKRADEGDWDEWGDHLPSQFLAKQSQPLIKRQLGLAEADKVDEFNDICALTNPTVKKTLLKSFADDCDSASVHLQAAALPRQRWKVILPVDSIKDNEVYAPDYEDGETVALIRYPHGGTFEIPILKVNNKNPEAKRVMGTNPADACGINSKVAERLSGADFDGDTVMIIPTGGKIKISSVDPAKTKGFEKLVGFDPKMEYPYHEGMKVMSEGQKQKEMGVISNLITDMTLKGASSEELARAVRHSMVVIDAAKHKLDFKQSEKDNGIAALKKRYQGYYDEDGKYHEGAGTLISRAKSQKSVVKRQGSPKIDPETGNYIWKDADDATYEVTKTNKKTGEVTTKTVTRTQRSTKMAEAKDAYELISDLRTPAEIAYADYANKLKSLANQARKEILATGKIEYSARAKDIYKAEVDSLDAKLALSEKNAPRERLAQTIASATVAAKKQAYPDMTKKEIKKASQVALTEARLKVGAKRRPVEITDREWEAIQAGAISESKLVRILNHADTDAIRARATPRTYNSLSTAQINKIKRMSANGYTTAEIAKAVGVSTSSVSDYIRGKE